MVLIGGELVAPFYARLGEEILMRATDLMSRRSFWQWRSPRRMGIGSVAMLGVVAGFPVCSQRSLEYVAAAASAFQHHILFRRAERSDRWWLITLDLGNCMPSAPGLSFLGLGVVPPTPEWGLVSGHSSQWWVATSQS